MYEIFKKLKEAGFPQEKIDGKIITIDGGYANFIGENTAYSPTTDELIEALGDEISMSKYPERTIVFNAANPLESTVRAEGETPKIALANLYIKLHPKKQ